MNYKNLIRKRLRNLGVDNGVAASISIRFQKQVDARGLEGATLYLKRVGEALLHYLDPNIVKPKWVKTRNRFPVFLLGLEDTDEVTLLRVAKFARAIRLDKPSTTQVEKAKHGVLDEARFSGLGIETMSQLIRLGVSFWSLSTMTKVGLSKPPAVGRQFRKVMSVSGKVPLTMEPPLAESLDLMARAPNMRAMPSWEYAFYPVHPSRVKQYVETHPSLDKGTNVGQIHAAQEGGAKLRMFAAPYTVFQCVLSPIHDWIDRYRRSVLTDCTYDQLSGARWAQEKLQAGIVVHSVDLSTATCRFPLGPQLDLLRDLGLADGPIAALEWACKGKWQVSSDLRPFFRRKILNWKVGQPLGIRPSMSMFSLAHNLVLTGLCVKWELDPLDTFRVLGDDVVIAHDLVARDYKLLMKEIGVPTSIPKSFTSPRFAEFAGASITNSSIVRGGQWKHLTYENVIGLAELYQRPLAGEGTLLLEKIQQVHLFGQELFDPPVDQWPQYVQWYSLVRLGDKALLEPPKWMEGRGWYDAIKQRYRAIFGWNVQFLPGPDPLRELWKVTGLADDDLRDNGFYIHSTAIEHDDCPLDEVVDHISVQVHTCIYSMFMSGLMSKDEALRACEGLRAAAASLLYVPPRDRGRRLHALADAYANVIRAA